MYKSFHIKNYKCFSNLILPSLGGVNLFVGKNNVGKSTVLEAISLAASDFSFTQVMNILSIRGEEMNVFRNDTRITSENEMDAFMPLISQYEKDLFITDGICVGNIGAELCLKLCKYVITKVNRTGVNYEILDFKNNIKDSIPVLAIFKDNNILVDFTVLDGGGIKPTFAQHIHAQNNLFNEIPVKMLTSRYYERSNEELTKAWAGIAMTEYEPFVVQALQIIEPKIKQFNIIGNDSIPFVTVDGLIKPVRLSSMGDGLNKILHIILTMLSCKDGIFLIDEVENGLHFTSMTKLWKIIFDIANRLNIQVFATTHSIDCITSYLSSGNGHLIRIERFGEQIKTVQYDEEEKSYILTKAKDSSNILIDVR